MSKPDAPDIGIPFDILTSKVYRTDSFPGHPFVRVVFGSKMADMSGTKNGVVPMVEIRDANTGEPLRDYGISDLPEALELINESIENLRKQIDKQITTWFYNVPPSPQQSGGVPNQPASNWDTAQKKEEHVGDLYYDRATGNGYRWVRDGDSEPYTYYWSVLQNDMALEALRAASKAQDTADNKRRIFYNSLSGTDKPSPPYDIGDLLVTPESNGNLIYKCVESKTASQSFSASDWVIANNAGGTASNYMQFIEGTGLVISRDATANGANTLITDNSFSIRYGDTPYMMIMHDEETDKVQMLVRDFFVTGTGFPNPKPVVLSSKKQFYSSTSSQTTTGGVWSDTQPEWTEGRFIWSRDVTIYSDAPTTEVIGTAVCITGNSGDDAVIVNIDSSNGTVFRNSDVQTVLTVSVIIGDDTITTLTALRARFGPSASIKWQYQGRGETQRHDVAPDDSRISQGGFAFTVTAQDVNSKVTFWANLDY